jgi:hypothetical protein
VDDNFLTMKKQVIFKKINLIIFKLSIPYGLKTPTLQIEQNRSILGIPCS